METKILILAVVKLSKFLNDNFSHIFKLPRSREAEDKKAIVWDNFFDFLKTSLVDLYDKHDVYF